MNITKDIQLLNDKFMEAFDSQNAEKIVEELFSIHATMYPPGSLPVTGGKEVMVQLWNGMFEAGIQKAAVTTTNATAYGDIAIETGNVQLYAKEGVLIDDAKYIVQWIKENGKWKVLKNIWNTNISTEEN